MTVKQEPGRGFGILEENLACTTILIEKENKTDEIEISRWLQGIDILNYNILNYLDETNNVYLEIEEINDVIGEVDIAEQSISNPSAPGMLSNHYAPRKELLLGDIASLAKQNLNRQIAILSFTKKYSSYPNFVLSETGDMKEAAKRLFTGLRWFDSQNVDLIIAERVPNIGLGRAINDRIFRASYK